MLQGDTCGSWSLLRDDTWTQPTSFQPMKPSLICKTKSTYRTHDVDLSENLRVFPSETTILKLVIWCAVSGNWFVASLFFDDTIWHERVSIFAEFVGQLTDLNLLPAQGATCHTYARSFARLHSVHVFTEEGTVSAGLWSARSPDSKSFLPPSFVKRESVEEQSANLGRTEIRCKPGD
jgi:hypothetical protein